MSKPRKEVHNLIILDESGSMQAIKQATIDGFNGLVSSIRGSQAENPEQHHFITLMTFNGLGIRCPIVRQPVASLQRLDDATYLPASNTPLMDAIGTGCTDLEQYVHDRPDTWCLVTILTDGMENASKEYSGALIHQMIERLRQGNWTFTYIGANHDVKEMSRNLNIENALDFMATGQGTARMWAIHRKSSAGFSKKLAQKDIDFEELKRNFFTPYSGDENDNEGSH